MDTAERIVLAGYSLPITDFVAAGMLAQAFAGREDVIVEVVNPNAEEVGRRVTALGGPDLGSGRLTLIDGDDCVRRYTVAATGRAQERLAEELRHLDSPATHPGAVVIVWSAGADPINGVVSQIVDGNDGVIELILDDSDTYGCGSAGVTGFT